MLSQLFSVDDGYSIHNMAKVDKWMTDLEKDDMPKKVAPAMFE